MTADASPPSEHDVVPWWREAVIYEIYVRSFADADGDGIGDLAGIRSRLPALVDLGVDAIWLTPFYPSPQADGGYDVADPCAVDPRFGTMADFDALLATAHELGLRLLVDIVPNHTSVEHPWFRAALAGGPGSPARDRYWFRPGRGPAGDEPPNDWQSVFGGPAWTRITEPDGQPGPWYLHLFAPEQPDLDWTRTEVRDGFESILAFWLDRGVDGFRIDVAHGLVKDPELADIAGRFAHAGVAAEGHPHWDRDEVHDIYRGWRRLIDTYPGDRIFVAEAYLGSARRLARYVRPDELHTAFNFDLLLAPWDATALTDAIDESITGLTEVGATPTWVLSNHDMVRHVTRYGGGDLGRRRARAAALLLLALPGAAYLYQGEELGLPEVTDLPDDALQDPTFLRSGGRERGRDGCRVPLPWAGDEPSYGFGPGPAAWLPHPADWAALTREQQVADADSMLHLYRSALALRRDLPSLGAGPFAWAEGPPGVVTFHRGPGFTCVVNVGDDTVGLDATGRIALASGPLVSNGSLPGVTAVWLTS
ncbi:MAG: glycoside hydrolase family 13 protein [Acidimicrobiales bacterium]